MNQNVIVLYDQETEEIEVWGSVTEMCEKKEGFSYNYLKRQKFPFEYKGLKFYKVPFRKENGIQIKTTEQLKEQRELKKVINKLLIREKQNVEQKASRDRKKE